MSTVLFRASSLCTPSRLWLGAGRPTDLLLLSATRRGLADAAPRAPSSSSSSSPPPPNSAGSGMVKTPEVAARDATIARLRKKEEEEAKYGATFPKAVFVGVAGAVVAVSVLAAWLMETGLLNRRSFMRSLMGEHQGHILTEDYKCNNTCAGCDKPITGNVVVTGGELRHPQHHTCHQCNTPLQQGHHYVIDGKPYCEKDFHFKNGRECAVCGDRFSAKRGTIINAYGDVYCATHQSLPTCSSCQRPISARTTSGGVQRADGRSVCSNCSNTAISSPADASKLLEQVRADVEKITGMDLGREEIRVSLVPLKHFGTDGVHTRGVTKKHVQRSMMRSRVVSKSVDCVELLDGLPRLEAGQTLAHEIMHCHVFTHGFPEMPRVVEEGLCELVSYLWLAAQVEGKDVDRREVSFRLSSLEKNTTRVYGQGLQLALRSFMVSNLSFSEFMTAIKKTGKLPQAPPAAAPTTAA